MNKPVPWNIKGVGFDAREAARLAAKRAGQPVGEWLNDVIAARAAELGVSAQDIEADDRLEAIAARLSASDDPSYNAGFVGADRPSPPPGLFDRDAASSEGRRRDRQRPPRPIFDPHWSDSQDSRKHQAALAPAVPARLQADAFASSVEAQPGSVGRLASADRLQGAWAAAPVAETFAPRASADVGMIHKTRTDAQPFARRAPASDDVKNLDKKLNAVLDKLNRSFEEAERFGETATVNLTKGNAGVDPSRPSPAGDARQDRTARRSGESEPVRDATSVPDRFTRASGGREASPARAHASAARAAYDESTATTRPAQASRSARGLDPASPTTASADVGQLQHAVAQLSDRLAQLVPETTIAALEAAVKELGERVDQSRLEGIKASVLAPVEQLGREMREAIRASDATALIGSLQADMQALVGKIEALHQSPDQVAVSEMRTEIRDVRATLDAAAKRIALSERLQSEISGLSTRVDGLTAQVSPLASSMVGASVTEIRDLLQTLGSEGLLGSVDRRVTALASQVEALARQPAPLSFNDLSREINRAHEDLLTRLGERPEPAGLVRIEESIGSLSAKIDAVNRTGHDMSALFGLVGELTQRIEEVRSEDPDSSALNALQSQIGQLIERFDRSEATMTSLGGLERLMGDLFLQVEQSRNAAIDAAQHAARSAAQDTIRAALDNPTLNGGELAVQTGLDVTHVSQELAELRHTQEFSERRVNTTLAALNTTLERLVDRMLADQTARSRPAADAAPAAAQGEPAQPVLRKREKRLSDEADLTDAATTPLAFDPDQFLLEPGTSPDTLPAPAKAAKPDLGAEAPMVEVGQRHAAEDAGTVGSLIAAARRAAKLAQASAAEAALKDDGTTPIPALSESGKVKSFFARRRRPLLLSLTGFVLLVGTLQFARLPGTWLPDLDGLSPFAPHTTPTDGASDQHALAPAAKPAPGSQSSLAPAPDNLTASSTPVDPIVAPKTIVAAAPPSAASLVGTLPAGFSQSLRDLAASGSAPAQYEVASRFAEGRSVARDGKLAADWFELAAQQGLAPAQYRLASAYEKGVGRTVDPGLATGWYEKAANGGNVRAMHNLAVMLADGAGAKPDYTKAIAWFTKAAGFGIRDSQFNLAVLYARGLGVQQDLGQSYTWFALAAQQGDTDAAKKRDTVAAKLEGKALADAKAVVASFKAQTPDPAVNDVAPPPAGWDGAADKTAVRKTDPTVGSL